MGQGAFSTFNPIFQILRPISPIAWIRCHPLVRRRQRIADISHLYLIRIPMVVQTTAACTPSSGATCGRRRILGVSRYTLFRQVIIPPCCRRSSLACASLACLARRGRGRNDCTALRTGYLIIDSRNAGNRYDLVITRHGDHSVDRPVAYGTMRLLEGLKIVRWRYAR